MNFNIKTTNFWLYLINLNFIIGTLYIQYKGYYIGDIKNIKVNNILLDYFILIMVILFNMSFFYIYNLKLKFKIIKQKKEIDLTKIMFLILIYHCFITWKFGLGKAYAASVSGGTLMLYIFPLDQLFYVYSLITSKIKKGYYMNLIIFSSISFLRGWSYFILILFIIYLIRKQEKIKIYYLFIITLIGTLSYTLIYPVKNYIRFGYFNQVSINLGIEKYLGRVTNISNIYYFTKNIEGFKQHLGHYSPFQEFFNIYLPNLILVNKSTMSSLVAEYKIGFFTKTSWSTGSFLRMLFSINNHFTYYILILFVTFLIFKFSESYNYRFKYVTALYITIFINGGSLVILSLCLYSIIFVIILNSFIELGEKIWKKITK